MDADSKKPLLGGEQVNYYTPDLEGKPSIHVGHVVDKEEIYKEIKSHSQMTKFCMYGFFKNLK